ncbi:DUF938 domain-containing protein [Candidatus Spongiihabitans sp.]|uniref:DUF938 domain-containing protein n=1 Tax=Candidatus Spongiihabitans sp. TaxID=3101308 RepID=UPI003C7B301A
MKPFSQACENNKQPILEVLKNYFAKASRVLEIGSGSGQHAVFFAKNLPGLFWQTSDQVQFHPGINLWIADAALDNIGKPIALDVRQKEQWPAGKQDNKHNLGTKFDGVFSANTAHIMGWDAVVEMFRGVGCLLLDNGLFILYGPFNRNGEFTSPSNQKFHGSLLCQDSQMGIRDDRAIVALANRNQLSLIDDVAMPANNRMLVFSKCFYAPSVKSAL